MARLRRFSMFALAGLATGLFVVVILVYVFTNSRRGMEWVRVQAVSWLDDQVHGTLRMGSISGAGLLGGLTLHEFEIKDSTGRAFVYADSARMKYDWRTLIRRRVQLQELELFHPRLVIEQLPGDSLWNFQHIFPGRDSTPGAKPPRKLIVFDLTTVHNAQVEIRQPFNTAITNAMDTARIFLEKMPGGLAKVMRFDSVNATFDRVIWESPIETGRMFRVKSLRGRGFIWREPVSISKLVGSVLTRDTIVTIDLSRIEFGSSRAGLQGRVIRTEGKNRFDLIVDGDNLEFKDLLWAYPKLPETGNVTAQIRVQSQRPKGTLFYASNARIVAPGTRMSGNFGVVIGDTLYFTDVNLVASPLNLELLEGILPPKLPLQGLLVGTVEIKSPR